MDKIEDFEKDNVLKAIEKTLECPVCLDTLTPPLFVCCNKHCVCSSCGQALKECPICRSEMANNVKYPIVLDNILQEMPRKCETSEHCKVFMPGPELKEHMKICPHRCIYCKIVSCSWKGIYETLLEHVATDHKDFLLDNGNTTVTFEDFSVDEPYYSVKLISCLDCLFWMYTKNDPTKGKYKVVFTYIPLDQEKFEFQIKFVTKGIRFSKTKEALSQDVDIEKTLSRGDILSFPSEELSPFIDDKKQLMYEINVFKTTPKIKLKSILKTNKNEETIQNMFKRIFDQAKCQFCNRTFLPPIKLCANYHLYCKNCDVTNCSLCNDSAIVSSFKIRHKCRHSDKCEVYDDDRSALAKHEEICKYRAVRCRIPHCSKMIQLLDLIDHIKSCHPHSKVYLESSFSVECNEFHKHDIISKFITLTDCMCWLFTWKYTLNSILFIFCICFPIKQNIQMYSRIRFYNPNTKEDRIYTQPVFDENTHTKEIFLSEKCMVIPLRYLSQYIDSKDTLQFTIELFNNRL